MDQSRGILYLADPLNAGTAIQKKNQAANSITLIFNENGHYLSLGQTALWRLRQRFEWICVSAEGSAACIAIALAAQLPVDRLVLTGSSLFVRRKIRMPRELVRLEGFARRNLALVVSEILLVGEEKAEIRGFTRGRNHGKLCILAEGDRDLLTAPWETLSRNSLLIP